MDPLILAATVIVVLLAVYLTAALLKPEWFQ